LIRLWRLSPLGERDDVVEIVDGLDVQSPDRRKDCVCPLHTRACFADRSRANPCDLIAATIRQCRKGLSRRFHPKGSLGLKTA
jgi:hypothetical protein